MTGLDLFALFVLLILFAAAIAIWVILGMLPGRISRSRNHPQVEAIHICGWVVAHSRWGFSARLPMSGPILSHKLIQLNTSSRSLTYDRLSPTLLSRHSIYPG